jgi:hypothetical protein
MPTLVMEYEAVSAERGASTGHGLATLATTAAVTFMTVAQAASMSPLPAT